MTLGLALVAWATVVATLSPAVAARAPSLVRYPRLGLAFWLGCTLSFAVSAVGFVVVTALDDGALRDHLLDLLRSCAMAMHPSGDLSMWSWLALVNLPLVATVLLVRAVHRSSARRRMLRRHQDGISILGRRHARVDAVVVDHDEVGAYSFPGTPGLVVLTSAATTVLTERELDAVVAHERAHIRGRHHFALRVTSVLAPIPWLPFFRTVRRQVSFLLERLADESACKAVDRNSLASALRVVTSADLPLGALGIASAYAEVRAYMIGQPRSAPRLRVAAGVIVCAALAIAPVAITGLAITSLAWSAHCV